MKKKSLYYTLLKGTFILTLTGIATRILGFIYRVFLTNYIGAAGIGLIQVVTPVTGIALSACAMGIQTAICKYTAMCKNQLKVLCAGLLISMPASILASIIVYTAAPFIAENILLIPQSKPLVEIISFNFPFSCFHICVSGYYLGRKQSGFLALSQLIEQVTRISFILIYAGYYINKVPSASEAFPVKNALFGNILGDIAATLFCIITVFCTKKSSASHSYTTGSYSGSTLLKQSDDSFSTLFSGVSSIFLFSVPLTLNRILLQLLQSAETILVPAQLILSGLSKTKSLEVYGTITGMALPLVLFPTALTNSLSSMLLPVFSDSEKPEHSAVLQKALDKTICICCLLGVISTLTYIFFLGDIGSILFNEPMVKPFVQALGWLCPFMYLTSVLSAIIKGLGYTAFYSSHSIISVLIKILILIFFVPVYGINAYTTGILIAVLYTTFVFYIKISRMFNYKIKTYDCIIKPFFTGLFSVSAGYITNYAFQYYIHPPRLCSLLTAVIVTGTFYLLLNINLLKHTFHSD